jgi:hypothetical protein
MSQHHLLVGMVLSVVGTLSYCLSVVSMSLSSASSLVLPLNY